MEVTVVLSPAATLMLQAITSRAGASEIQAIEDLLIDESTRQLAAYIRKHAVPLKDYRGRV